MKMLLDEIRSLNWSKGIYIFKNTLIRNNNNFYQLSFLFGIDPLPVKRIFFFLDDQVFQAIEIFK